MSKNILSKIKPKEVSDFQEIMKEQSLHLQKSYSTPDTPAEYTKFKDNYENSNKFQKYFHTTKQDIEFHKKSDFSSKLVSIKENSYELKDMKLEDPCRLSKAITPLKTSTSIRIHLIKNKFLSLVCLIFMSLSIFLLKIILHSHKSEGYYKELYEFYINNINSTNYSDFQVNNFSLFENNATLVSKFSHHRSQNHEACFFLGFYLFVFSIIFIRIDKIDFSNKKNFHKSEIDYLLIRGITGYFKIYFAINAFSYMRLISSLTLFNLSSIIFLFILLLKNREKIKLNDKVCLSAGLIIILIFLIQDISLDITIDQFEDSFKGVFLCICVAILCSINNFIDKKICHEFHSYVIIFITSLISIIFTPILMCLSGEKFMISTRLFILYLLFSLFSFFSFYYDHKLIENCTNMIHSTINNTNIIICYIFAIFVMNESFTYVDLGLSILMITINIYISHRVDECEDNDFN